MELCYLEEFVVLAETGSFHEAAEQLYITQSALSRHINSIETELGVQLLDRTTRKVSVNKFGQVFLKYATEILAQMSRCTDEFSEMLSSEDRVVNVSSITTISKFRISEVFRVYRQKYPEFRLNIIEADSLAQIKMLKEGKCDFAFCLLPPSAEPDIQFQTFHEDILSAVLPSSHPLAGEECVRLSQLKDEAFVLHPQETYYYQRCVQMCRAEGFEPKVVFNTRHISTLIDMVGHEKCVSIQIKSSAHADATSLVSVVDIAPPVDMSLSVAYCKNRKMTPAALQFLKTVREVKSL